MGMFDTVLVKNARDVLPLSEELLGLPAQSLDKLLESFQTKDIDSSLDTYSIEDGQLYIVDRLWSNRDTAKSKPTPYDWTGDMYFYNYVDDLGTEIPQNGWIEYVAKFYSGQLQSISLKEVKIVRTDEKTLADREEFVKQLDEYSKELEAKWYNRFLPNAIRNAISRALARIGRAAYSLSYKIAKH